jgi:hypothetical protein
MAAAYARLPAALSSGESRLAASALQEAGKLANFPAPLPHRDKST